MRCEATWTRKVVEIVYFASSKYIKIAELVIIKDIYLWIIELLSTHNNYNNYQNYNLTVWLFFPYIYIPNNFYPWKMLLWCQRIISYFAGYLLSIKNYFVLFDEISFLQANPNICL